MVFFYCVLIAVLKCSWAIPLDNVAHHRVSRQNGKFRDNFSQIWIFKNLWIDGSDRNCNFFVGIPLDNCLTPNNQYGSCVEIRSCHSLLALVNTKDEGIKTYLRRSFCGRNAKNGIPKVCCPHYTDPVHFDTSIFRTLADGSESPMPLVSTAPSVPSPAQVHAKSNKDFTKCGISSRSAPKIVGGQDASLGKLFVISKKLSQSWCDL